LDSTHWDESNGMYLIRNGSILTELLKFKDFIYQSKFGALVKNNNRNLRIYRTLQSFIRICIKKWSSATDNASLTYSIPDIGNCDVIRCNKEGSEYQETTNKKDDQYFKI